MKTATYLLLPAIILLLVGCKTNSGSLQPVETPSRDWARRVERATFLAASLHLEANREDIAKYEEARGKFGNLFADGGTGPTNIIQVIESLPLKGRALLYREAALLALEEAGAPGVNLDLAGVHELVAAADRGIARAVAGLKQQ